MIDALKFLGKDADLLSHSPDLVDDTAGVEVVGGTAYGSAPLTGLGFVIDDAGKIKTLHLHRENHEGNREYPGPLPLGLRFDMSRDEVRASLGKTEAHGEPGVVAILGPSNAWDRFDVDSCHIHVEYEPGEKAIVMVTAMVRPTA